MIMGKSSKSIKFIQPDNQAVDAFEKEFDNFEDAKKWVLQDKLEGYGDVLGYGGHFEGLSDSEVEQLSSLTLEDASTEQ